MEFFFFFFFLGCDWENVNLQKEGKEKEKNKVSGIDDVATDVAQQEHSNNKCYTLAFRYIYIYIYIYMQNKRGHCLNGRVNSNLMCSLL